MGIYLPNMEMPISCDKCRFFAWSRGVGQHCAVASDITFHATINGMDVAYERNGNCPLVPVPPHGDLIDRDALLQEHERIVDSWGLAHIVSAQAIRNAPAIIEAEEGE